MADTRGLVQRLIIGDSYAACVEIGPSPADVELLSVDRITVDDDDVVALRSSIVDALAAAFAARREVLVSHGDTDGRITSLSLKPA